MSRLLIAIILCMLASPQASLTADHWSSFQNGGRMPAIAEDLPTKWTPQDVAWTLDIAGYGQSSPVVWDAQAYVTYCVGDMKETMVVQAVDVPSGKSIWKFDVANSTPEKSSTYVSRAAPTPVVDAEGVIAFFEGGNVVALDHRGGERWQRDLVKDYGKISARHGLASSLEQTEDRVFVWVERSDASYVLALDKKTGETIWKSGGVGKTSWASPRLIPVSEGHHLVLSASGRIVGLDPQTGDHLWGLEEVANNSSTTPQPLGQGRFLIGASEGRGEQSGDSIKSNGVIEISQNDDGEFTAKYLWRAHKAMSSFGSPIVVGNNAYFVSRAGVVYCVDAGTGKQHYAKRSAGSIWATPIRAGNRLYLFGRDGTTTVIAVSDEFKTLATNRLWSEEQAAQPKQESGGAAAPAMGGPVLYAVVAVKNAFLLRRGDRLYCIRK